LSKTSSIEIPLNTPSIPALPRISGREAVFCVLAIVLLVVLAIVLVLAAMFFLRIDPAAGGGQRLAVLLAANAIQVAVMLGAVYLTLIRGSTRSWTDLGFFRSDAKLMIAAGVAGALLAGSMEAIERFFGLTLGNLVAGMIAPGGPSVIGYIGVVMLIGIATPLAEEVLFRGVLYSWMRSRWRAGLAVPLNCLLFGLVHLFYPPPYIALVALLGAVFAFSFERARSLWIPVMLHAGHNTAVITAVYISLI
jgi:membrane protease YdiL (CAAX protease family)